MPRAGDPYLNGDLPAGNNPLNRVDFQSFKVGFDFEAFFNQIKDFLDDYLFPAIKDMTGIDLSGPGEFLGSVINVLLTGGPIVQNFGQTVIDIFTNILSIGPLQDILPAIVDAFQGIAMVPGAILGAANGVIENLVNALIAILGPIPFLGDAVKTLAGFLGLTRTAAATAQATASSATTVQSQQTIAKPGYLAMDATADAVFPITNISGSTPSTINVTSAASDIGYINTPDNGKKSSIIWLGQNTTGLTAFYINLYKMNVSTGLCTLLEASTNILSSVSNTLAWNYYSLNTPINSEIGDVYAVEAVVVGSGTYKIAGIPGDWKPANTIASYPHQLGSERTTGLPTAPATFTPTYSGTAPWFGLGGFEFAGPVTTPYTAGHGTYTYAIPNWLKYGDCLDVILVGAGGGGQASVFFATGDGGSGGTWVTQTLIYGIDIPVGTTSLTVTVGTGGHGGLGTGAVGGVGGDCSIAGTGLTTVTAAGGAPGTAGGDATGYGPGDTTFNGVTYHGGANVGPSGGGSQPGGGGGGGGPYNDGAGGGDGAVWIAAYQAGKHP